MRDKNGRHIWYSEYSKYEFSVMGMIGLLNSAIKGSREEY